MKTILTKPLPGKKLGYPTPEQMKELSEKFGTINNHNTAIGSVIVLEGAIHFNDLPQSIKMELGFVTAQVTTTSEIENFVRNLHGKAF
jgi:hypothetical protein